MGDSNITIGEMKIVSTAFVALVIINGVFFATGLFDDEFDNEPPVLNMSSQDFITAGEFPEAPGIAGQGTLVWDGSGELWSAVNGQRGESLIYVQSDYPDRLSVEVQNASGDLNIVVINSEDTDGDSEPEIVSLDSYDVTNEGQTILHENTSGGEHWVIEFNVTELENVNEPNMYVEVDYEVVESNTDTGAFAGIIGTGEGLAQWFGYLGLIVRWFFAVLFELIITVVTVAFQLLTFGFDLASYLINGWINVTDALSDVSVFLTLLVIAPQLVLYFILFNFSMKILKVLPTT